VNSQTSNVPPYPAPDNIVYPSDAIPNPSANYMGLQPSFSPLEVGSLFRPLLLPADIDSRIDTSSVWVAAKKGSSGWHGYQKMTS
jgi:hypothetical protein